MSLSNLETYLGALTAKLLEYGYAVEVRLASYGEIRVLVLDPDKEGPKNRISKSTAFDAIDAMVSPRDKAILDAAEIHKELV